MSKHKNKQYSRKRRHYKPPEKFINGNVEVFIRKDEDPLKAIRKFCKKVKKDGILDRYKASLVFEKPSDKKRRKRRAMDYKHKLKMKERQE